MPDIYRHRDNTLPTITTGRRQLQTDSLPNERGYSQEGQIQFTTEKSSQQRLNRYHTRNS